MDLSLVIPVYNEEESLRELVEEIHRVLSPTSTSYEIILIDDGSVDRSFELLREMAQTDSSLVIASFRRNFGQTAAMQAGLDAARGDVVVTMDADMQNDPADIPLMLDKLNEGYDMVAGWRTNRKDRFIDRRLPSVIANWLISATTNVKLHDYGCTIKAMRKEVAKELRLYGEMHRFVPVMASLVGCRIAEMKVNHRTRRFGRSKYGIGRTVRVILDLLTVLFLRSYMVRPMQVFGLAGLLSGGMGVAICVWLAVQKLVHHVQLSNRPLLMLGVMLVMVGVQLMSLGLIADVLSRTYHEAQGRRTYHVREWIGQERGLAAGESERSANRPLALPRS